MCSMWAGSQSRSGQTGRMAGGLHQVRDGRRMTGGDGMAFWSSLPRYQSPRKSVDGIHHRRVHQQVCPQPSLFPRTLTYKEQQLISSRIHLFQLWWPTNCNLPYKAWLLLVAGRWLLAGLIVAIARDR